MHIVLFSPIPFDDLHQRPQQLAGLLAGGGARVTYVEPGGVRAAMKRGLLPFLGAVVASVALHLIALAALASGRRARAATRRGSAAPGRAALETLTGPLAVPVGRSGAGWLNAWTIAVHRLFLERTVLPRLASDGEAVALVEFPFWGAVLEPGDFDAVFYDCLDDFGSFAGRNSLERFMAWERRLVEQSRGAFASARALEAHVRALRPDLDVRRAPNGVDVDWFRTRAAAASPPAATRRPVAGYVGVIGRWLDYALIEQAIAACAEVDFVFVGPAGEPAALERLRRLANFRWVPRQPYDAIPGIVRGFDACLIPFAAGPIARSTNPVKVFEYFALGKPVVTTPVDELEPWRAGELVYWAADAAAFAAAVQRATVEDDAARRERRLEVARAHTWRVRAADMLATIESALAQRKAAHGAV
jgi:glycosyltransferase involved in cell wall biosynthesis